MTWTGAGAAGAGTGAGATVGAGAGVTAGAGAGVADGAGVTATAGVEVASGRERRSPRGTASSPRPPAPPTGPGAGFPHERCGSGPSGRTPRRWPTTSVPSGSRPWRSPVTPTWSGGGSSPWSPTARSGCCSTTSSRRSVRGRIPMRPGRRPRPMPRRSRGQWSWRRCGSVASFVLPAVVRGADLSRSACGAGTSVLRIVSGPVRQRTRGPFFRVALACPSGPTLDGVSDGPGSALALRTWRQRYCHGKVTMAM